MKKGLLFLGLCFGMISMSFANETKLADTSALRDFVGKYKFPDGSVVAEVVVAIEDTAITMSSSAGTSALEKIGDDLYTIVQFQGTAKFNRNADKVVIGVSIKAMGYELEGTKDASAALNQLAWIYIKKNGDLNAIKK